MRCTLGWRARRDSPRATCMASASPSPKWIQEPRRFVRESDESATLPRRSLPLVTTAGCPLILQTFARSSSRNRPEIDLGGRHGKKGPRAAIRILGNELDGVQLRARRRSAGSNGAPVAFFMYPQAETADGRLDSLDPDNFKYEITATETTSTNG